MLNMIYGVAHAVSTWNLDRIGTWLEDAMLAGAQLLILACSICLILLLIFAMTFLLESIKLVRKRK